MSSIRDAVADLDENQALDEIRRRIKGGEDPERVLTDARRGLQIVGERFNTKRYALIELEMADELFRECVKTVESLTGETYSGHPEKAAGKAASRLSRAKYLGSVD